MTQTYPQPLPDRRRRFGRCRICEKFQEMTPEHVPPFKAFNDTARLKVVIDELKSRERNVIVRKVIPGQGRGRFHFTLCNECNNKTGAKYGPHYVNFVRNVVRVAQEEYANSHQSVTLHDFYPGAVMKQVVSMILSTSYPARDLGRRLTGVYNPLLDEFVKRKRKEPYEVPPPDNDLLREVYSALRHYVKVATATGLPDGLRVYAYAVANKGGGYETGIIRQADRESDRAMWFVPVGFWPVHFVLSLEGEPLSPLCDVTGWGDIGFKQRKAQSIEIPVRWAFSPFPTDFRSRAEVIQERFVTEMACEGFRPRVGLERKEWFGQAKKFARLRAKWMRGLLVTQFSNGCYVEDGRIAAYVEGARTQEVADILKRELPETSAIRVALASNPDAEFGLIWMSPGSFD